MNVRQWKAFQAAKQKWVKLDYELKVIVIVCLAAMGAWLFASAARAEDTGSGQTPKEMACLVAHENHAIIRDARIDGHEREEVKGWLNKDGPKYDELVVLIDEAYDAVNVDAWFAGYMLKCMGGEQDAEGYGLPFVRVASSQAIVSPSLMLGYACHVRVDYARRAIYAARRALAMPAIPESWSEKEQRRMISIQMEALVWPRGEIDFVDYVGRECAK